MHVCYAMRFTEREPYAAKVLSHLSRAGTIDPSTTFDGAHTTAVANSEPIRGPRARKPFFPKA